MQWRQTTIDHAPVIRLQHCRVKVSFPDPVSNQAQEMLLRFVWELGTEVLEGLLSDKAHAKRHLMQQIFQSEEEMIRNVPQVLEVPNESFSGLRIANRLFSGNIWVLATSDASSK